MNGLQIDINNLPDKNLKELLIILNKAFRNLSIDFYLIGARARDLWFNIKGIQPKRFTYDIDFAVLVSDINEFERLIQYLVKTGDFKVHQNEPYRLVFTRNNYLVDLLPFGDIEEANYTNINGRFETKISVLGLKEVFDKSVKVYLDNDLQIKIASLAGLCILKLISWDDRKAERERDLVDLYSIVNNFFDFESEEIYIKHLDLFDDSDNFNRINVGAKVLGRQMADILARSEKLKNRIITILSQNTTDIENSRMGTIIALKYNMDLTTVVRLLEDLLSGILTSSRDS
jgi:predicted nucleotidyltransferase